MTNAEWEAANEDDSDRWMRHQAETGLEPPRNATHRPSDDRVVWRDRGARIAALETENAKLREDNAMGATNLAHYRELLDVQAGEVERLLEVVDYALHLRMYGERAPGGDETWRKWDAMAETVLRALLATTTGEAAK